MAATEDITLIVALDDRAAQTGLDGLRQQTESVAASSEGAAGGLNAANQAVGRMKNLVEPTGTAINGMASAMGGLSSQTGAVFGAASNLATAFMSGGPLALGIVAIGTGVSWLSSKWKESKEAAEKAEAAQKKAALSTAEQIEAMTKSLEGRLSSALGADEAAVTVAKLRTELEYAQQNLDQLTTGKGRSEFLTFSAVSGQATDALDRYQKEVTSAEDRVQDLSIQLANAVGAYEEYEQKLRIVTAVENRKKQLDDEAKDVLTRKTEAQKREADSAKELYDAEIARMVFLAKLRKEAEEFGAKQRAKQFQEDKKAREQAARDAEKAEAERTKLLQKAEEERAKIREEAAKRQREIDQKSIDLLVDSGAGAFATLVGTTNDLVIALATGQEQAFERASASFLSSIGSQLVGIGTKAIIEGAIISANPLTPGAGAPMIALGAGAVATGIGLGAAGAAISTSLGAGGGGGGAAASSAASATPRGAGRIATGTVSAGPGGAEAITYVFNAPVFGDQTRQATHVARLQRRASRDLLLA
jgi:chemotaxis protein histidine kinase CheA